MRTPIQLAKEELVMSKIRALADFHVWPDRESLDPDRWLTNFKQNERPYAVNILNVFLYFNNRLIDAMFLAAIHSLSSEIISSSHRIADRRNAWRDFLSNVIITYVQGEQPNPTDSGYVFARKARQVVRFQEEQVVPPAVALRRLLRDPHLPVLFVDDFVGSGAQMTKEWNRPQESQASFRDAYEPDTTVYYVPLVATTFGLDTIHENCPGVRVRLAHILDIGYSLTSPRSFLWPTALKANATDVLWTASRRAGILDRCQFGWQGFQNFALAMSFEHSVPDATLPLIYWDAEGWQPLIRRT